MQQNDKPKLYYATMAFPYGTGEKTFVLPELQYLSTKFDITILSGASKMQSEDKKNITYLDNGIKVIRIDYTDISISRKLFKGISALFKPIVRSELIDIFIEKKCIIKRSYQSMAFYLYAQEFVKKVKKMNCIEKDKPILFYSYWYNVQTLGAILLKKEYPFLKVVTRTHGFDLYNERISGGRQPYKKIMDKQLAAIFFICEEGKEYYIQKFMRGQEDERYIVAPIGTVKFGEKVDVVNDNTLHIVSCSALIPLKRVGLIIDALSLLPEKYNVTWVHFGDGICKKELENCAITELKNKRNISYHFYGNMDNSKIHEYYIANYVNAFISTSSTEGLPVSMQEALSYGIPLIATDVGGVHELVKNSGILMSASPNAQEVCEAIIHFCNLDETTKESLYSNAYELWRNRYNAENNVKKMASKLKHILEDGKV